MKTSTCKAKGRRLQNLIAQWVSDLIELPCGPDEPIEPRQMGQNGVDIRLDSEARRLFPFSVECKNQETWSIPSWIEQAKNNLYPGTQWLLIVAKNRTKPVVVIDAEAFFKILRQKRMRTK